MVLARSLSASEIFFTSSGNFSGGEIVKALEIQKNLTNNESKTSMIRKLLPQFAIFALALLPSVVFADADRANTGAVYTMDNSVTGNNVLAFHRSADGSLMSARAFSTGGNWHRHRPWQPRRLDPEPRRALAVRVQRGKQRNLRFCRGTRRPGVF